MGAGTSPCTTGSLGKPASPDAGRRWPAGHSSTRARSDAGPIIKLVTANEALKRENAELLALNEQLRAQLDQIGSALGKPTNGSRRRGGRGLLSRSRWPTLSRSGRAGQSPILSRSSGGGGVGQGARGESGEAGGSEGGGSTYDLPDM
jgi:hypothetical protein